MIRLLFLGLLLLTTLVASDFNTTDTNDTNQSDASYIMPKVLYLSYKESPKRVLKGEIFSITIKTLSTVESFSDVIYEFSNYYGLEALNTTPYRDSDSKYYYDTFHFLTTSSNAKLPDITASLSSYQENLLYPSTTLVGPKLNVVTLNPKKNFSNIIANSFEIVEYKTTSYDNKHNIIVLIANAKNCDIKSLNFRGVFKQGVESITDDFFDAKIIYYAVINKELEEFSFSYFNLLNNRFSLINIPIIVNDDSVTTQSDLKPKDQSRERLKMLIAAVVALVGFIFIFWRKKYVYLIFIIIPLAYIVYIGVPSKELCIKQGSQIYLLPVDNGTVFETTSQTIHLQKEGSVKKFFKVKLKNEKIGWVKNEDICTH